MKKATRQHTKTHNNRLVLRTIYNDGPLSRADVARVTRLTRTTVSDIVGELMQDNLVDEVGLGESIGGKPPILLGVVDDSRHLIGVDLANSEFRGAVIDLRGRIVHRESLRVEDRNGDAALELVYELVDKLVAAATSPVLGIGIGTPGLMDPTGGIVRKAVNLDWQDLPLRDLLASRYDLAVYIANDSQGAALGEYFFGDSPDTSNLIVVKVGRGISAGIVLNGQLFYGDGAGAGEIGHTVIVENGEQCMCGHFGCLETVASSRAIVSQAKAIARNNASSRLLQFAPNVDAITTDTVLQAFEAGDSTLQPIIEETGRYLGLVVSSLVGTLNIHHILIGGSVSRFGEPLLEPIRQQVKQNSLAALADKTCIEMTNLGNDIVVLGAASLVLTHELGLI